MELIKVGLIVVDENGRRSAPHTLGPATLIGFDPSVDVRVEDPSVGDRHLLLSRLEDGTIELVDMGSGGTKLNGQSLPVGARMRVGVGDTITLGSTALELIRLEGSPVPTALEAVEKELPPEYGVDWGDDRRRSRKQSDANTSWILPAAMGVGMIYLVLTYGVPAVLNKVTKPLDLFPNTPTPASKTPPPTIPDSEKTYDPMYVPPRVEEPIVEEPLDDSGDEPPAVAPPPPWLKTIFGRPLTSDEATQAGKRTGEGLVAWVLTQRVVYERWLAQERRALGLTGTLQPRETTRLVAGLRGRTTAPLEALGALAKDKSWGRRHLGAGAFADAVLTRLLGVDPSQQPSLRQAAQAVYEGTPTSFLGQVASSPEQVISAALADPRAREALVLRAWRQVSTQQPDPARLVSAASQVEGRPHDLFRLLVEWARDGK